MFAYEYTWMQLKLSLQKTTVRVVHFESYLNLPHEVSPSCISVGGLEMGLGLWGWGCMNLGH